MKKTVLSNTCGSFTMEDVVWSDSIEAEDFLAGIAIA